MPHATSHCCRSSLAAPQNVVEVRWEERCIISAMPPESVDELRGMFGATSSISFGQRREACGPVNLLSTPSTRSRGGGAAAFSHLRSLPLLLHGLGGSQWEPEDEREDVVKDEANAQALRNLLSPTGVRQGDDGFDSMPLSMVADPAIMMVQWRRGARRCAGGPSLVSLLNLSEAKV